MVKNKGIITLKPETWSRIKNKMGSIKCYRCERDLNVGEEVYSYVNFSKYKLQNRRYYCMKCAKELNLI